MNNSIKYDPLSTYKNGDSRTKAVENLLSVKIETDLEEKMKELLKELIETNDSVHENKLKTEIFNIQKDIEDIKRTREINVKNDNGKVLGYV